MTQRNYQVVWNKVSLVRARKADFKSSSLQKLET